MPLDHPLEAAEAIRYNTDSRSYDGLLFHGASDQLVIVYPDWRGCLTDYALRRGHDLARISGATVCVTDAYGADRKPVTYGGDAEVWIAEALADPAALRQNLSKQINGLRAHLGIYPKHTAIVGYCLGGALALEAGRSAMDLDAVVSVHGIPSTNKALTKHPGKTGFLAIHGSDDPIIGSDHLRAFETEMSGVGADWQTYVIGGARHGFTSEEADPHGSHQRYDPQAAARALHVTDGFLKLMEKGHD